MLLEMNLRFGKRERSMTSASAIYVAMFAALYARACLFTRC
jgi:hypothetical protein